jgi:predicted phosphodiesterase
MRKLMIRWFQKPVLRLADRYSSRPDRNRIFASLSDLLSRILNGDQKKGLVIPFDPATGKFIIFSDQHKGARNGADDFVLSEPNYLAALDYYFQNGFHFISLGDCEELWENSITAVGKAHKASFDKEKKFIPKNAFVKIFGNHDLYWDNDPFASFSLKELYGLAIPVYEAAVLECRLDDQTVRIFCTHGHQGDKVSDGNWFSKWFVSRIWAPLQSYLKINPNTPAYDRSLKSAHNNLMYQWSHEQKNLILITGHTHQPVFESLTHLERLYRQLLFARQVNDAGMIAALEKEIEMRDFSHENISPDYLHLSSCYFNTGCCCLSDGDITGIEIEHDCVRLIKWQQREGEAKRVILEETPLKELLNLKSKIDLRSEF